MRRSADYWIQKLNLSKHPEGGSFAQVYRSDLKIAATALPHTFGADRNVCTSIYFLLQQNQFSAFHRIKSDEIWHFYYGDPLTVYEIDPGAKLIQHHLSNDPGSGESFQCIIKAGNWFAAKPGKNSEYALVGCTVSPGFDFKDFELASKTELTRAYPQHEAIINLLCIK